MMHSQTSSTAAKADAAPAPTPARNDPPQRAMRPWQAGANAIGRLSTTRANARAGLVCDVAVSSALLLFGLQRSSGHPFAATSIVLFGLVLFSFIEYCFHRWLFHGRVDLLEQGHRRHHDEPLAYDSLPFFAPPLIALALAWLLAAVMPMADAFLFIGGIAAGYAAYGLTHSMFHAVRFRNAFGRRWAAAHHVHHFHPDRNFGVTTPLWDIILQTRHRPARTRSAQ